MICPLLSYQSRYKNCLGSSCAWWDDLRDSCAVLPQRPMAAPRLDSDVELVGV